MLCTIKGLGGSGGGDPSEVCVAFGKDIGVTTGLAAKWASPMVIEYGSPISPPPRVLVVEYRRREGRRRRGRPPIFIGSGGAARGVVGV